MLLLELAAVLVDFDRWPSTEEFVKAGHGALCRQVEQTGGAERWAAEFGLPYAPEVRDPEEEQLRDELSEFLIGFDRWPTVSEFQAARRFSLYSRILTHGGMRRWAAEFGLATIHQIRYAEAQDRHAQAAARRRGPRRTRRWTAELVRTELAVFLSDARYFPSQKEFAEAGEATLYRAVERFGGAEHWAAEFELPRASDRSRQRAAKAHAAKEARRLERRDPERMLHELEEFCAAREFFPSKTEWLAADREDLAWFVQRNGGVHEWAKRIRLPLRPAQDRRPYGLERAVADGRAALVRFGRIPNSSELQKAGYGKLWTFIRREFDGDRAAFAKRL